MMAVASVQKTGTATSRICVSYDLATTYTDCQDVASVFVGAATNQLKIGGGVGVTLRQIEIWDAALPIGDMECFYNDACTAAADGTTCDNCELAQTTCPFSCAYGEYFDGAACAACYVSCRSCFGGSPDKCYACSAASTVDLNAEDLGYTFDDSS
jgi:hypothetical protein